jgi:hypothetical protein
VVRGHRRPVQGQFRGDRPRRREPLPQGPLGVDATAFAPFADGTPDLDRIGAALGGAEESDDWMFAELQHRAIIESLGLPSEPLTLGHRHVDLRRFPAAQVCSSA